MDSVNLQSLQNLAANDAVAHRAFEILTQRQRKRTELTVEVLMRDMGCPRSDVVKFLKSLGELGCGRFLAGRGSKQSRFRWRYAMYSVAQVALGQAEALEELPWEVSDSESDAEGEAALSSTLEEQVSVRSGAAQMLPAVAAAPPVARSRLINHTYPLRPDLLVPIGLPADLSAQEAERLAAFIRALALVPPT